MPGPDPGGLHGMQSDRDPGRTAGTQPAPGPMPTLQGRETNPMCDFHRADTQRTELGLSQHSPEGGVVFGTLADLNLQRGQSDAARGLHQ